MKTIKIAHLYYDLMNLYGESGNMLALTAALKRQGVKYTVTEVTKGDKIDFSKFDIFYMGMGTLKNQQIVLKDILRYKTEIEKIIKKKVFIMTGNSYELFGLKINNTKALGIFNFTSKTVRERIVGEQVYKTYILDEPVVGFQNRGSINSNEENHLFEVIDGNADNNKSKYEGIHINNFYGSYTIGPLLVRNPHLLDKILKDYFTSNKANYKEIKDTPDYKAYNKYLENFHINRNI
ncbi:MAG: hypothetical protein J1F35_04485 [Erysipelotrichales bacterium]|nr:hypothetical protein [Erysipelotrichales bacterium]